MGGGENPTYSLIFSKMFLFLYVQKQRQLPNQRHPTQTTGNSPEVLRNSTCTQQKLNYLLPTDKKYQTPKFYGLPKMHKKFTQLPPLRPIVLHSDSIHSSVTRSHTTLLAQSCPDYLQNSTALSIILEDLHVPEDAILVSIDVTSLYLPSLRQNA